MTKLSHKLSLCLAVLFLTGCTSGFVQTSKTVLKSPMKLVTSRSAKPVAKILCLWEASEGQGLDELPSRGFAGQIMFFTYGAPSPMKVDGTVRIYQYADFDAEEVDPTPIHNFKFDSTAWNAHRSEGTLGHSYNVFLPYVLKHKGLARCALRVEFEDANGQITSAPITEVVLPSKLKSRPASAMQRPVITNRRIESDVAGASARTTQSAAEASAAADKQLDTLTISLPQ